MMMRPPLFICLSAVLERRLCCDEGAADVNCKDAVEVGQSRLLDLLRNDCASVVHKHVDPAECGYRLLDRAPDCLGIGGVGLNGDGFSAGALNRFDDRRSRAGIFRIRDGHTRSIGG
jgi:hypothetical protein